MSGRFVPYAPSVEQAAADEAAVHGALLQHFRSISETVAQDEGHAFRSVHAKTHGVFAGELEVLPDLPAELAQGLFAEPGRYPAVMRLSTIPGDLLDDMVSGQRGIGLKISGVQGERLPGAEDGATQNFAFANAPAFAGPNEKVFLAAVKLLAATTDKAQWAKKLISAGFRGVENALEAAGGGSEMLKAMGGMPITHPLGDGYYSQTAFRYGELIAKFALVPVSPNLTALTGERLRAFDRPDALRDAICEVIGQGEAMWELRVQLCTDLETMPVEDASKVWDEAASPYRTVARLTAPRQPGWGTELATQVDERTYFSPWQGLAAHRPLGSVNRARREIYEMSAGFRARFNGCPVRDRFRELVEGAR